VFEIGSSMNSLDKIYIIVKRLCNIILKGLSCNVYFGKPLAGVQDRAIVFFPYHGNRLSCGLTGIVAFKHKKTTDDRMDVAVLNPMLKKLEDHRLQNCKQNDLCFESHYLGGKDHVEELFTAIRSLKSNEAFYHLFVDTQRQDELSKFAGRLSENIESESKFLSDHLGRLQSKDVDILVRRIDILKDIAWCATSEIAGNIKKIKNLLGSENQNPNMEVVNIFKQINAVLNSIDRLEVRGRDSAGVSMMFVLEGSEVERFKETLKKANLLDPLTERSDQDVLVNSGINLNQTQDENGQKRFALALTYKIAAVVGRLGDNGRFLRKQIKDDGILQRLAGFSHEYHTISAHTRWASVGAITEPNCHPVDNTILGNRVPEGGIIHACLNGDIDNYLELKKEHERQGCVTHKDITTDTKIIPLQIGKYIRQGFDVAEAFRRAVNDFEGSHAISMHTDLAPGKLFLAQKGSGQAIFVGIADDHYVPSSEVYGLVEETPFFIKLDGEKEVEGRHGVTQGQIFILNQEAGGGLDGIEAMYYDRTPLALGEKDIKYTEITPRDIDRQEFPHYFLKEISEAPLSVEKTFQNRWKIKDEKDQERVITLDEKTFPEILKKALMDEKVRRIFLVGQGTAGVAAQACADIMNYYLNDPSFYIRALKASELSGFQLCDTDRADSMADALVVAISQSGTTTDTNRAVDMVKERGAYTMAIVNRRDSDITFKVDGVMYTSSGRDIEMSVASTKAFYSQIVAGAILGLKVAELKGRRDKHFITAEIKELLKLPDCMKKILSMRTKIGDSARRLATAKTYWAVVGSGPNKASADEIRIKLSELCYKTISSDFIEDKKHIDLSSEPLIIVCAAGARGTVISDIIKDTAIFQAHKATPVVIADAGEDRFGPYAADVFHVPMVSEHFAPILNTLVGHIWGYYAAITINEGSRFLYEFNKDIQNTVDDYAKKDMDVYELILEKSFREKIALFYKEFRRKKSAGDFPTAMGLEAASDLTLLLKYLSGRMPVSDFEMDFSKKGTPLNMLNKLFECLGESINSLSRPVDAIRHQAKTVTVGTSRISERLEGILFDTLEKYTIRTFQLTNKNIIVLKNLQKIVAGIEGAILYRIGGLNLLGEPTDETTIEIVKKDGVLKPIPSRVETDPLLKGSKRIIVREGNVYIGIGRKDDRSIIVIPIISASPATANLIENILLLNISFKENVLLGIKIKALGGKYERIKNIVQENSVVWEDRYLELVEMKELFGISAEKIGEFIVSSVNHATA
jgi:glucosamine--fructose-6-phosphate aminotransferase (isomerizing)